MKHLLIPMSLALGVVLLATAAPGAQEANSDRAYPIAAQDVVGPWTLVAASDPGGAFHHCELSRQQGRYQLSFLRGTAGYVLVVVNLDWQLPEGATYTVGLDGDGLDRVDYEASTAGTGIIILLGDNWELVNKLRDVGMLRLHTAQSVIPLPMDEAGTGLDHLEACWTQRTGAVSNPFATSDAGSTNASPFAAAGAMDGDVAVNSAMGEGGHTITVPGISAFGRLVELTADRMSVPEIAAGFGPAAGGAEAVAVVYRGVGLSGVAGRQDAPKPVFGDFAISEPARPVRSHGQHAARPRLVLSNRLGGRI